ncbi:substrate-binding domain-containing protein [Paenibacillus allorhizosphaerae]|uniref:HTH-type transcriptional repressor MelR n=1 Tax=Paenibacillus allorhizosphaerae TaxID=2849866 RepID=A0ABN7TJG7_9BACL|nr:substrate-binding domain-containing protein [Paenibacillus allorhizosphaerae]CAG7638263.1 HTH-type transcriptional repressor MelR [Paenibacillus allorhizosphaerae]
MPLWCKERGLRVPGDTAIAGFDNLEAARFAEVPLTTVAYNVEELTAQAFNVMLHLMSAEDNLAATAPVKIQIEPSLVIRQSCGAVEREHTP